MSSTELMDLAAFNNAVPAAEFQAALNNDESLADGIGSSYGIIGYKGKVWTLRLRGETYTFVRKDDGSPQAFLDVIVLRSAPYKSKSYYAGGYTEGANEAPACSSLDGISPSADAREKQAAACAICPRNEWKTNAEGRKGRDCAEFKRLAVLLLPSQSMALLGSPLMEPVFLRVPAASLNDLAKLGEAMQKKGFHYSSYITRIGFQVDKPHPQMTFKALQPLTAKEAPIVLPMREDAQAIRITGENEVGKSGPGGVQQLQPAGKPTTTKAPTQTTTTSPSEPSAADKLRAQLKALEEQEAQEKAVRAAAAAKEAGPVDTGFGGLPGRTDFGAVVGEVIPPTKNAAGGVDTGFGGLGETQSLVEVGSVDSGLASAPLAPTMANTEEDTGPAEDADGDLDGRVAALLQR